MQELSMNVLDIAENSTHAGAKLIEICLAQDTAKATQTLTVKDDGKGMPPEMVREVTDPFCTTRTTRKVGLGLPLLKMTAEMTGGEMHIESEVGVGTTVTAVFGLGHIDLMPIGDMGSTISALTASKPDADFIYRFSRDEKAFEFDTREAKEVLGGVSLAEPAVTLWVREHVNEGMAEILA